MHALFQTLPGLIDKLQSDETRAAIVFAIWPTVLGEQLRQRTVPREFGNGELTVAVSSVEWKREFDAHAPEIVYKLNRSLNSSVVKKINVTFDPKLVHASLHAAKNVEKPNSPELTIPEALKASSAKIADIELRGHFLEAAAISIGHRDAN